MIIITVQDLADGNVEVKMNAEPPVYSDQPTFTDAQRMGAVALNAIHGAIQDIGPKSKSDIVIAGADEMPL